MTSNGDFTPDNGLLTLGNSRISPINMANSYATIANGGERADVHVITKVVDRNGNVRYQWKNHTQRVLDEDIAADTSYAMQQVVKSGTGRAALALDRPAAGKTGTATNDKGEVSSSWFVGYTPQLSTAVMYVRGDGDDQLDGWMPSYFGADYPTDTWLDVMKRDLEGQDVLDFPPPAWVDGNAPVNGHDPVPTQAPKPKPTKTKKPTPTTTAPPLPPTTTAAPPTQTPTQPATEPACGVIPTCGPTPGGDQTGTASPPPPPPPGGGSH